MVMALGWRLRLLLQFTTSIISFQNGIEILKYLGLQEMLNDPDFADFVSWFRENLNEENYLAEEDVTKYDAQFVKSVPGRY